MWWLIPLFLVGFILVHLAKMFRLYLVLMEHEIGFGRFIFLYVKTTFINLIIPFKIGEIYRIFCISRETKHWQVGILSIVVDRFFDTLTLLIILLPLNFYLTHTPSKVAIILCIVLLFLGICYVAILPTYQYLNQYFIRRKSSKRSLAALKGLDVMKIWYDFTKDLIRGRFALILLSSFAGWVLEIGTLKLLAMWLNMPFGLGDYSTYIESIFDGNENILLHTYTLYGAILMAGITTVVFICLQCRQRSRK